MFTNTLDCIICYLIGSFPSGYLLAKLFYKIDLRKCGSGSTGATNILRCTHNKFLAGLTLIIDFVKGILIAWLAKECSTQFVSCFFGLFGHIYPCWIKFHGGRGVTTAAGIFLVTDPICACIAISTWLLTLATVKISTVASLMMSFTFLLSTTVRLIFLNGSWSVTLFALETFILLIYTHRENLKKLHNNN